MATFLFQNSQNKALYEEISTLKDQIVLLENDTLNQQTVKTDTVYLTQYIDRIVRIPVYENNYTQKQNKDRIQSVSEVSFSLGATHTFSKAGWTRSESQAEGINVQEYNLEGEKIGQDSFSELQNAEKQAIREELASNAKEDPSENNDELLSKEEAETIALEPLDQEKPEDLENIADSPVKVQKKKLKLPKMRVGVTGDYLGLNVFASGLNAEVFLFDRLSLNAGILFSGKVVTNHSRPIDFNRNTGKVFSEEFRNYRPFIPEEIKDISITTSFVRMPVHFNYYIPTWSQFKFMVSAGTKLDLSVYQDIDFNSSLSSSPIRNRFEARPEPKVLNNINYGMGLEYQYRGFVGQLMPYFNFRRTDYFTPKRKFGIVGSLKYQLGK